MNTLPFHPKALSLAIALALGTLTGAALADPPSRVARLGYMTGMVSLSPAGEEDWIQAGINRPITVGDRVWAQPGARAELQVGAAMVRFDGGTAVSVLDLDDRVTQLRLTQGRLNVRVRTLGPDEEVEVDTPNLALTFHQAGAYSIEVNPDDDTTTVTVRSGSGEVYAGNEGFSIGAGQAYRFTGDGLRDYGAVGPPRLDEFERWAGDRDRSDDRSASARYVPRDMVGYRDLDEHGSWRVDANYGNVWMPNRVPAGWSPYSDGHWAWVDPWGWTWVDEAPWGFAVSHYGRWNNFGGRWGWVPGQTRSRAYYAPALVAFIGGSNFQISISSGNVGGVGWFPLAPREVYRPTYEVSRGYYENVNRSNTVVNNTVINNTYNTTNVTNVVYANRTVPGAVVAVPTTAFVQSQPVARVAVRNPREDAKQVAVIAGPGVVPTAKSARGAAEERAEPPKKAFEKPVVARRAPPPTRTAFAVQQPKLAEQGGKPLDDNARKQIVAAAAPTTVVPVVRVATPLADGAKVVLRPLPAGPAASAVDRPARTAQTEDKPGPDAKNVAKGKDAATNPRDTQAVKDAASTKDADAAKAATEARGAKNAPKEPEAAVANDARDKPRQPTREPKPAKEVAAAASAADPAAPKARVANGPPVDRAATGANDGRDARATQAAMAASAARQARFAKAVEDARKTKDAKDVKDAGNAKDAAVAAKLALATRLAKDAKDAQMAKDAKDAQMAKDAKDAQMARDAKDAKDTKDAKDNEAAPRPPAEPNRGGPKGG